MYPTTSSVRPSDRKNLTRTCLSADHTTIRSKRQSILLLVSLHQTVRSGITAESSATHHNWLYRHIALPIFALLRMGASPQKLAWSLAIGVAIGINPLLGSTTILCLAVAFLLRLNIAASQLANHVVYPLELLLVIPFIHLGTRIFHTAPLPLSPKAMFDEARHTPITLIRKLWLWESHALIIWACIAAILIPAIALILTPLLTRLLHRIERHQYPILADE
jgi:uncharacterized protein (DUF2062 family)